VKGEIYIRDAKESKDHLSNVFFQAENVYGWLLAGAPENAAVKARCLLESAQALVAAFEYERVAKRDAEENLQQISEAVRMGIIPDIKAPR